jgi:hypothetical protein
MTYQPEPEDVPDITLDALPKVAHGTKRPVPSHAMWITPGEWAKHHDHCPCIGTADEASQ